MTWLPPGSSVLLVAVLTLPGCAPAGAVATQSATVHHAVDVRGDALAAGFRSPPQSAKPRVWWHWMDGNITKYGIKRDLAWMHRIGIGGVDIIEASHATPQVVRKVLPYMSPGWQDAFRYAVDLANSYGMEVSIDSSPGWSETGGPWVTPQQAMKKLVWSVTRIQGGKPFHGVLPQPPGQAGPIQNIPISYGTGAPPKSHSLNFYRDSIVIAYKEPLSEIRYASVKSDRRPIDADGLVDGDLVSGPVLTPSGGNKAVSVVIDCGNPAEVQGITLAVTATGIPGTDAELAASDDGKNWRRVTALPAGRLAERTASFPPVTHRYFRLTLSPAAPTPLPGIFTNFAPGADVAGLLAKLTGPPAALSYHLRELILHAGATVNAFEAKAGFAVAPDYYAIATPDAAPGTAVKPRDVRVLSSRMKPDGTFDWTPPPGHWVVLRMGYSPTGQENRPAPAEATGLEVDKLNRDHVRNYMQTYLDMYEKVVGAGMFGRRGLNALTLDSTEIGAQNWTEHMIADFKRLRGYDPTPWLPALTGAVVGSARESDRFLWDFRRTIAELLAKNHYDEIDAIARQRGLTTYVEALEDHRPSFGDDMEMRRDAAIPMAAMWMYGNHHTSYPTYIADILGAASIAHVYGQNLVAAESLTSVAQPWAYAPRALKPVVDLEFVLGVNRIVVHSSVHQPVDRPPGLTLYAFGQFFNRLETWADDAGPWMSYIARSSYLLQQGRFVGDIAYFYGEEAPITGEFGGKPVSDVPPGHAFDFVNSEVLLHRLSVAHGRLITGSGAQYRALYLGGSSRYMTLAVLRRIRDLVLQGAVLVGRRPIGSPSLADRGTEFQRIADNLFGKDVEKSGREFGKGRVFADGSLANALVRLGIAPDFSYTKPEPDTELLYLHRKLSHGEIYFVSNRQKRAEHVVATFRVRGLQPEIWNAVTGKITPADYKIEDRHTRVPLTLGPYDSVFVVFRKPATAPSRASKPAVTTHLLDVTGPWTVTFQKGRGAPSHATMGALASWNDSRNDGIKYFSGKAVYTKYFTLPAGAGRHGAKLILDLGDVRELADVRLNGKRLGTLWTPPFKVDITRAVRPGGNVLQVGVTNLWVNRLIGDAQPNVKKKHTFTTIPTYRPDAPLRASGLLGPVRILRVVSH